MVFSASGNRVPDFPRFGGDLTDLPHRLATIRSLRNGNLNRVDSLSTVPRILAVRTARGGCQPILLYRTRLR
ncbi:hypothetical protein Trydic_g326 [Trypoxylus dichotomus]